MSSVLSMIFSCHFLSSEEVQEAIMGVIIVITSIIDKSKK